MALPTKCFSFRNHKKSIRMVCILKDKVIATLKGTNTYDKLTKEDIDSLILAFKEIQESLNG